MIGGEDDNGVLQGTRPIEGLKPLSETFVDATHIAVVVGHEFFKLPFGEPPSVEQVPHLLLPDQRPLQFGGVKPLLLHEPVILSLGEAGLSSHIVVEVLGEGHLLRGIDFVPRPGRGHGPVRAVKGEAKEEWSPRGGNFLKELDRFLGQEGLAAVFLGKRLAAFHDNSRPSSNLPPRHRLFKPEFAEVKDIIPGGDEHIEPEPLGHGQPFERDLPLPDGLPSLVTHGLIRARKMPFPHPSGDVCGDVSRPLEDLAQIGNAWVKDEVVDKNLVLVVIKPGEEGSP